MRASAPRWNPSGRPGSGDGFSSGCLAQQPLERVLNLSLLGWRRHRLKQRHEVRVGDAALDEGVALGPKYSSVDVQPLGFRKRSTEVALEILDIERRLLSEQTVHGGH